MTRPEGKRAPQARRGAGLRRWLPLAVLVALMAGGFALGLHESLTLSNLIMRRQDLGALVGDHLVAAIAAYGLIYALAVALSFPGAALLTIAGGFLFGWLAAGITTVLSATLGACAVFLVARSSLGETLTERAGPFVERLARGFRDNAFHYLLFLRLTPVFPFWLVNIAPAVFRMPLSSYALATLIGIVPGTFAFTVIGSGLDSVIAAQEEADPGCAAAGRCQVDVAALVTPELLAAFFALGLASLLPVVLKKLRAR